MTEKRLSESLKVLYPTPDVSSELAVRAFQAVTRRHQPTVWPRRLAWAGVALALYGGVVLGNRVRLASLYLRLERAHSRPKNALGLFTREQILGRESRGFASAEGDYSFSQSPTVLTDMRGRHERKFYKHWNWLVERDYPPLPKIPATPNSSVYAYAWQLALSPSVRFTPTTNTLTMSTGDSRLVYQYDPTTEQVTRFELWLGPEKFMIQSQEVFPSTLLFARKVLSETIPANVGLRVTLDSYRLALQQRDGEYFTLVGGKPKSPPENVELLQSSVNQSGEVFFLWRTSGFAAGVSGAIDDQGRHYILSPSKYEFGSWSERNARWTVAAQWLIPVDKPGATPPRKITLVLGEPASGTNAKQGEERITLTLPFRTQKCRALPEWAAALDNVPESPDELETERLLARGHAAFLRPSARPDELVDWFEKVSPRVHGRSVEGERITSLWLSRGLAESGEAVQSRKLFQAVLDGGIKRQLDVLSYAQKGIKHSPKWRAACGDLWKTYGLSLH